MGGVFHFPEVLAPFLRKPFFAPRKIAHPLQGKRISPYGQSGKNGHRAVWISPKKVPGKGRVGFDFKQTLDDVGQCVAALGGDDKGFFNVQWPLPTVTKFGWLGSFSISPGALK
jgi:hypothetical protein